MLTKVRKLPIDGKVLVELNQTVTPETVVAKTEMPGQLMIIHVAEKMNLPLDRVEAALQVKRGDTVQKGQTLAEYRSFGGLFKTTVTAPSTGIIEVWNASIGALSLRLPSEEYLLKAYISGMIREIIPNRGAVIESQSTFLQGIFGVGGEQSGVLDFVSLPGDINESFNGKIIVGQRTITQELLDRAVAFGVKGIIAGSISEALITKFVGHDIGVAVTGTEKIPLTIIITEGFGEYEMDDELYAFLSDAKGVAVSINGATQVRAGAVRPEIFIAKLIESSKQGDGLSVGSRVRVISEPHFGMKGKIAALSHETEKIETGAMVRTVSVVFESGEIAFVPKSNVENFT